MRSLFKVKAPLGGVAEWLCSGLQSRVRRFDSDPRLQTQPMDSRALLHAEIAFYAMFCTAAATGEPCYKCAQARMAK